MALTLVRYERGGGRQPADDELLEVDEDGTWRARRTVGGWRVGEFAGRLDTVEGAALARDVALARAAGPAFAETPRDASTELVTLGIGEEPDAQVAAGASGGVQWDPLLGRLRALVEAAYELPESAVSVVELEADAGGARLVAAGAGSLDVDAASVEIRVVRLDALGVPAATWSRAADDATAGPRWERAAPGWTFALPFEPPGMPGPGEWLQVWVRVTLRTDARRRARLFLAIPGSA